jgi:hypothetical protein
MSAAAKNNSFDLKKLHDNIIRYGQESNHKNNANLSRKLNIYFNILEKELNDLEFSDISNLKFENETIGLNLKLDLFENLLGMFVDVFNILKINNKDEIFLHIKDLFKKKIINFSKFINTISGSIMKNSNYSIRKEMIYNLFKLQNQLNDLYELYEIHLKNSNKSARNLIKNYSNNIRKKQNSI